MNKDEVFDLMMSSHSSKEWADNCDKVKKACNGYPDFWYDHIIRSGLLASVKATWRDLNAS